ncbi:hypothetical protein AB0M02_20760 [Actinoplanes sp. NPDC051861]|uniref:hypothetical protein n=1 Tax=Actinoplanes sp. NPDC051861 TaxID=3155170 RepID=UPI003438A6E0
MVPAAGAVLAALLTAAPVSQQAPDAVCPVTDDRLTEISGLTTDQNGYVVINDGVDESSGRRIFFLDRRCRVKKTVSYPSRPRDTEDLARGPDGTLWVGDIGDNSRDRATIALWRLAPGAKKPTLLRMSYPDGAHDAEALLIAADGTPVVVTKDPMTAGIYVPTAQLSAEKTTPLRRAGDVAIPVTGTSNPFGLPGTLVVTGGATSADGRRAVLRTYADAFDFDVPDGDLVRALSEGKPTVIALPDEPQGESVAYSADGTSLLTISEVTGDSKSADLLRYPLPEPVAAPAPTSSAPPAPAPASSAPAALEPVKDSDGLPIGLIVAGVGLLLAAGALGIVVARRR